MGHVVNWYAGWGMVLAAFIVGAGMGMFFGREDFLGGYTSWRRRLLRLGHIALAALGLFNVVYGIAAWPAAGDWRGMGASAGLMAGGILMPAVCFLSAWRKGFKAWFFIPVTALVAAVVMILMA